MEDDANTQGIDDDDFVQYKYIAFIIYILCVCILYTHAGISHS